MSFQTTDSEIDLKNIDDQEENPTISRLNSIRAKGRWSSLTPTENESDIQTLTFKHTTKAQDRTRKRQQPIKLEPLPVLKVYQDHKQPEYLYEQNRYQLMAAGILKSPGGTVEKTSIKSLTPSLELQDAVRKKQLKRTGIGRRGLFGTKSSTYPKLYFHDREEVVKSNIRDPLQIIKIIHENEHLGFLYMIPAVPRSSIDYDTYNLIVVTYENIIKNDYYTISQKAVTHVYDDDIEFIEIDRWEKEYLYHRELTKIPIFALFRKWKAFTVWKKNVRCKKITGCRKALPVYQMFFYHGFRQ